MATRLYFASSIIRISPPWLRRTIAGRLMAAFGDVLDVLLDIVVEGVRARFPTDEADPEALARIGRERRIRRGPNEDATTYARRLRTWWDAHRTRGNAYALLSQLYLYFVGEDGLTRIDVLDEAGNLHWVDMATGDVTRESIAWGGSTAGWAHLWVVFHYDAEADFDSDPDVYTAIPREWRAAHIGPIPVVLLAADAPYDELWDYPIPVGAWDDPGDWTDGPTIVIAE